MRGVSLAEYHVERNDDDDGIRQAFRRGAQHVGGVIGDLGDVQQPEQRHGGRLHATGSARSGEFRRTDRSHPVPRDYRFFVDDDVPR